MNLELTHQSLLSTLRSLYLQNPQLDPIKADEHSPKKKMLIAYSGGLDSHVLLHLIAQISSNDFEVRAVYINHGLQSEAAAWALHCQHTCNDLKIPFSCINLNLKPLKGESIEELARNARYQALYSNLQNNEVLLTAHHQNDQAETVLLQLFRGAGVQGLAAMSPFNQVTYNNACFIHFRPLLHYSRMDLEIYAKQHHLEYIEDPSNQEDSFDRNYLRNNVMPLLRKRWQSIDKTISRSATIQAETKQLLDEIAEQKLMSVLSDNENIAFYNKPASLPALVIPQLLKHDKKTQRLLVRSWISKQGFLNPSEKKLHHIFSDLIEAAKDKQPLIEWQGAELRRYQQQLYIMSPLSDHDESQIIPWNKGQSLHIASLNLNLEPSLVNENCDNISIRFRQGGETIEIPKRGNISLKNLFQELRILPWMRSRIPLIYCNEKLIKIVGLDYLK